jgi:lysophospholipase L1-like esterase
MTKEPIMTLKSRANFTHAQRLLFIGDSITDSGRREAALAPLGSGYVNWFSNLLRVRQPARRLTIMNRGIGGNTAENLADRWQDDVISEQPDALVVNIGINDASRFVTAPLQSPEQAPDAFAKHLRTCLTRTRTAVGPIPILLITPFFLSREQDKDFYRGRVARLVPEYSAHMKKLAAEFNTSLLESQTAFERVLAHRPPGDFNECCSRSAGQEAGRADGLFPEVGCGCRRKVEQAGIYSDRQRGGSYPTGKIVGRHGQGCGRIPHPGGICGLCEAQEAQEGGGRTLARSD